MAYLNETGLARFWSHILSKLSGKVDKEEGKGLSSNDFTAEEKEKLAQLDPEAGIKNLVDGQVNGSIRSITSAEESEEYSLGKGAVALGESTKASGSCSFAEGEGTQADGSFSHAEGYYTKASGTYSHTEGYNTQANKDYSHAEGYYTKANGYYSHAEGRDSETYGDWSHAEGYSAKAYNRASHAEGYRTISAGSYSHAEGEGDNTSYTVVLTSTEDPTIISYQALSYPLHFLGGVFIYSSDAHSGHPTPCKIIEVNTQEQTFKVESAPYHTFSNERVNIYQYGAFGRDSHAEGYNTLASGDYSHAEGSLTKALGYDSHAEGVYTIANADSQHVQGKYNINDEEKIYAHILGNGVSVDARSNAFTVDWDGNGWFSGNLKIGGINQNDPKSGLVLTDKTIFNSIVLKDEDNNYEYIVKMKNGSLISYCKTVNVELVSNPIKVNYSVGESIDLTGLIIGAIGQDNSILPLEYTYSPSIVSEDTSEVIVNCKHENIDYSFIIPIWIKTENEDLEAKLIDFDYETISNSDGTTTYNITGWKGTTNGEPGTEIIVPNNEQIQINLT